MSRSRYYPGPSPRSLRTRGGHVPRRDRARDAAHRASVVDGEREYRQLFVDSGERSYLDYSWQPDHARDSAAQHHRGDRKIRRARFGLSEHGRATRAWLILCRVCVGCGQPFEIGTHECDLTPPRGPRR